MKRAIVLSGGGAKGAYQVGVWKALRKLKITYDIVTGTSVGAINGALMVQNDYIKAKYMWSNINFTLLFKEKITDDVTTFKGRVNIYKKYLSNFLFHGGMDVSQMEASIEKNLNYNKFYKSKIDYGLVTVNLSSFKPVLLEKKNIKPNQLKDYLVASATCFPAFKMKQIDKDLFIDGAYYDKIPINQAISMGATEIIAIDLNSFGLSKKVKEKEIPITYISPRNRLDSFLLFDSSFTKRSIKLGYNDTMKTFNKLDGLKYTFKRKHLNKNFDLYFNDLKEILMDITNHNKNGDSKFLKKPRISIILKGRLKIQQRIITEIIEYLGQIFKLDDSLIYDIKEYNQKLIEINNQYDDFNLQLIEKKIKNKETIRLVDKGYLIKYLYKKIETIETNPKIKKELGNYTIFLERDMLATIYLYVISKR